MPGAHRLELLCKRIAERYEHLVRYSSWHSRTARAGKMPHHADCATLESPQERT